MEIARQQFERQLIEKSWSDEKFRSELMNDPKSAIEKFIGQALPQNLKIVVLEEKVDTLYLRIPVNPEELSYEMLDLAAGGGSECSGFNSTEKSRAWDHQ